MSATENIQPLVDAVKNKEDQKSLTLDEREFRDAAKKIGLTKDIIEGLMQSMQAEIDKLKSYSNEKRYKDVLYSQDDFFGEKLKRAMRELNTGLYQKSITTKGITYQEPSTPSQTQEETSNESSPQDGTHRLAKAIFGKLYDDIQKRKDPEDQNKNT